MFGKITYWRIYSSAATVFSEEIHKVFVDTNFNKTFLHGHSFSANPVACAAALGSLNLFNEDETFIKIEENLQNSQ